MAFGTWGELVTSNLTNTSDMAFNIKVMSALTGSPFEASSGFKSLDDFDLLYEKLDDKPDGLKYDWRSDEFFASNQVMVNPVSIKKTDKLPFDIEDSQVKFKDSFDSLNVSMSEGRLYHVDHSDFEPYRTNVSENIMDEEAKRYMTSPIALFYRQRDSQKLIPLVIFLF